MKQQWTPQELIDQWTLSREELDLVNSASKTSHNRLGCAMLLKYFQAEGRFPGRKQDTPAVAVQHIAQQLSATDPLLRGYELIGRVAKRHRTKIRAFLGTNTGMKRVASGTQIESFRDLLYARNRFINKDTLRAAIAEIANAILRDRLTSIWGEATSCAADSKKFGAWDQNLLTE